MDQSSNRWRGSIIAACLLLPGCQPRAKPTGDIVARVEGQDVTTGMLEAEARARGIRLGTAAGAGARSALLAYVVSRQMLVNQAKRQHLDRDPGVLAERLRSDLNILSQAEVARRMAAAPAVLPPEVAAFERANPQVFAGREALVVDRVLVPSGPALPAGGRATMNDVVDQLLDYSMPINRQQVTIDSADLPAAALAALKAHPTTPLRITLGGTDSFVTLVSARPNPAPQPLQQQLAIRTLQAQHLDKSIADDVARLRKEGRIAD